MKIEWHRHKYFFLFFVTNLLRFSAGEVQAGTATLSWQPVTEDTLGHAEIQPVYYNIYCDTVPAFTPNLANFLAATRVPQYLHTDARLDDPNRHLFYKVRAVDIWGNESAFSVTVGEVSYVLARVRGFLEIPYDAAGDSMRTSLRNQGLMASSSPYSEAPRSLPAIPVKMADWVLVQLRNPVTATIVAQESFLLRNDGILTEPDGVNEKLGLVGCGPGNYQVILRHRNHLAVMSRQTMPFNEQTPPLFDFSADSSQYQGSGAAIELEPGVWGLWCGDINQDGLVTDIDCATWRAASQAGQTGYRKADLNWDGHVTTADYVMWYSAFLTGVRSFVP